MDDSNVFGPFLALYFLPNKRVHVISSSFQPSERLSFEQISRLRPLLIQNYGCEGIGHDDAMTVPGVGCLLFAPPSLALATSYPFSQSFLFVNFEGLAGREGEGRWNSRSLVTFELTADLQRAWVAQDAYVNLRLNPLSASRYVASAARVLVGRRPTRRDVPERARMGQSADQARGLDGRSVVDAAARCRVAGRCTAALGGRAGRSVQGRTPACCRLRGPDDYRQSGRSGGDAVSPGPPVRRATDIDVSTEDELRWRP